MRVAFALIAGCLSAAALAGCQPQPVAGPPPLRLSVRKAQIPTRGLVVGLNNPTDRPVKVTAVFVKGKDDQEERSYRIDREIKPLDSLSVGWIEFGGWKLKSGDKLRILCEGYTEDLACELTD